MSRAWFCVRIGALCGFALANLDAQTFEVATIKPSPPNDGRMVRGCRGGPGSDDPGLWRCTNATLMMLILQGYDVKRYQVTAPDWATSTNFEITAKVPPAPPKSSFT
jgi:uncharacterized protein (TIGR03435 family)